MVTLFAMAWPSGFPPSGAAADADGDGYDDETGDLFVDDDFDGISNDEEEFGYEITVLEFQSDPSGTDEYNGEMGYWMDTPIWITTDPLDADHDDDLIPDGAERDMGMHPADPSDGNADFDGDLLTRGQEYQWGTSDWITDSDFGGVADGIEVLIDSTNPTQISDDMVTSDENDGEDTGGTGGGGTGTGGTGGGGTGGDSGNVEPTQDPAPAESDPAPDDSASESNQDEADNNSADSPLVDASKVFVQHRGAEFSGTRVGPDESAGEAPTVEEDGTVVGGTPGDLNDPDADPGDGTVPPWVGKVWQIGGPFLEENIEGLDITRNTYTSLKSSVFTDDEPSSNGHPEGWQIMLPDGATVSAVASREADHGTENTGSQNFSEVEIRLAVRLGMTLEHEAKVSFIKKTVTSTTTAEGEQSTDTEYDVETLRVGPVSASSSSRGGPVYRLEPDRDLPVGDTVKRTESVTPVNFEVFQAEDRGDLGGDRSPNWKPHELDIRTRFDGVDSQEERFYRDFRKCVAHVWNGGAIDLAKYLAHYDAYQEFFEDPEVLSWHVTLPSGGTATSRMLPVGGPIDPDEVRRFDVEVRCAQTGETIDSLVITLIPPSTATGLQQWLEDESAEGFAWWNELPVAYSALGAGNTDPEPDTEENWRDVEAKQSYHHPGSDFEIRSEETPGVHGHQACYDESGNIIRTGISAGSADKVTPDIYNIPQTVAHRNADVMPFVWAAQMDGNPIEGVDLYQDLSAPVMHEGYFIKVYLQTRPTNPTGAELLEPGPIPDP